MNDGRSQEAATAAQSSEDAGGDPSGDQGRSEPYELEQDGARPLNGDGQMRESWLERVLGRFGLRSRDTFRTDLEDVLASTAESAGFSPQERAMLKNVLRFHRTRVHDVMVPRADIVAVAGDTTLGEMLRIFRTAGHSRLPVYGETLDDPKGMVHIRDFLDYLVARAESGGPRRRRTKTAQALSLGNIDLSITLATAKILRPVLFVPPSMPAVELLVRMQTTRTHMALVIDEYGGTDGLVSIEDLVEMVVGDIEDEHDLEATAMIEREEPDTFVADARADLEEVTEAVGIDLTEGDLAEDVDTLGGLIVTLAGRVPARSELIAGPNGLEFEVLDADPRRLKRIRIHRRDPRLKLGARLIGVAKGGGSGAGKNAAKARAKEEAEGAESKPSAEPETKLETQSEAKPVGTPQAESGASASREASRIPPDERNAPQEQEHKQEQEQPPPPPPGDERAAAFGADAAGDSESPRPAGPGAEDAQHGPSEPDRENSDDPVPRPARSAGKRSTAR